MGTAVRTAKTSSASWDAFSDVDAFVDEVLAELAAMEADGTKPTRSGPKPALTGAALRKAIMAIWCLCFCGMQWRAIGQLCDIPFNTLFTLFARWTRLGLWRRLLDRLRRTWRLACGDAAEPTAMVIDSRSCRSALSCFTRGFDGGKKINGVKVHLGVDTRRAAKLITASRWRSTSRQPTCMIRKGSSRCSPSSPAKAAGDRRWATSATGASVWPRPAGSSALPSSPSLAAVMASSSRPESVGWLSAPLPGFLITGG